MTRLVTSLCLLALACCAAPAAAQSIKLEAARRATPDDIDALTSRLQRIAELQTKSALQPAEAERLKQALLAACASVVVTGEVRDAPLSDALDALVRACQTQGQGLGVVISPADHEALGEARVTAYFAGTRATDALRALLRSQESNESITIELVEEGEAFVITVHQGDDEGEDKPMRKPETRGAPEAQEEEEQPAEPAAGGAFLGVMSGPPAAGGGVQVQEVVAGSPAEDAGLQANDVITSIAGREVTTWEQLRETIAAKKPGERVVLDVQRAGQRVRVVVTLGARQ
jgi:hypothetical protein